MLTANLSTTNSTEIIAQGCSLYLAHAFLIDVLWKLGLKYSQDNLKMYLRDTSYQTCGHFLPIDDDRDHESNNRPGQEGRHQPTVPSKVSKSQLDRRASVEYL